MTLTTKILPVEVSSISFNGTKLEVSDSTTKHNLDIASEEVRKPGHVVAFPTETVYGLGGSALCDDSVRAIYAAKNRPADNPLIVHVSSQEQIERLLLPKSHKIPAVYDQLIKKFWPGPLTILLPVEEGSPVSELTTAGQNTVGVRMPSHPVARALIAQSDTPLAAPSANASTRPSPTMASHVYHDLSGRIPYILDGGACDVGVESTVVDGLTNPPMLLRPGGVSAEDIRKYGGGPWENIIMAKKTAGKTEAVRTPGMKYRHYSPSAKVVLFDGCKDGSKAVKSWLERQADFDPRKVALLRGAQFASAAELGLEGAHERILGSSATEMAHNLFKMLREVDELNVELILVEGVEETGDGLAVMNRLSKAAFEVVR
ncbi:Sua5/YciO/YrdC/YwlC family tRNA threonylcarbamoyl adenosine modification protein [Candidozyma haemuli]|uniref:Threonylcarbamoyl-AMP synthase n=1 Tax=Candidozyma haemuli TaxID=45357 RepID=A0A2V1ALJ7_9ASCO|nr:Sua5/YciO/YrdC/YwlC family tRNA threonylcarbamoyl adenosine modification protein [[Candida] haemuloni]PVH18759.1 Sua5/YciO/YrdC/YwlC family tRNA threonylcarbamoyl adenosine modification protein [[Candida] haemuloni]